MLLSWVVLLIQLKFEKITKKKLCCGGYIAGRSTCDMMVDAKNVVIMRFSIHAGNLNDLQVFECIDLMEN